MNHTRGFGAHLKLNHKPSTSVIHVETHNALLKTGKIAPSTVTYPVNFTLGTKYALSILDQGNLGSCVCNSLAGVLQSVIGVVPSRLYFYFNALAGTGNDPTQDNGLDILQAMPILSKYGVPNENLWPYDVTKFGTMPALSVYQNAKTVSAIVWAPIKQTDSDIKSALYSGKFVMLGISVYDSFMTDAVAKSGIIPMPNINKEMNQGGHCIHLVGWTTYKNVSYYIIRNSWGTSWGNNGNPINPVVNNGSNGGFAFIPTAYVLDQNLAFEFISVV